MKNETIKKVMDAIRHIGIDLVIMIAISSIIGYLGFVYVMAIGMIASAGYLILSSMLVFMMIRNDEKE